MRTLTCLAALLLSQLSVAQAADPLKSPACGQAVEALEQARSQPEAKARVETLRKQAAQACLGQNDATRAPVRSPDPPVAVAPITTATPRPLPEPARPAPPPAVGGWLLPLSTGVASAVDGPVSRQATFAAESRPMHMPCRQRVGVLVHGYREYHACREWRGHAGGSESRPFAGD